MATLPFLVLQYADLKAVLGHTPSSREAHWLAAQARRCKDLGSWNALVIAAGDTPRPNNEHRRLSNEYLLDQLNVVRFLTGKYPRVVRGAWRSDDVPTRGINPLPSPSTYRRRYGDLSMARAFAQVFGNLDTFALAATIFKGE